jgi:hypothetical protein
LRKHEAHAHPDENVCGLIGLEAMLDVPGIIIDLHSDAWIEHRRPLFFKGWKPAGRLSGRLLLENYHSPLKSFTLAAVILGIGMMLRF